MEIDNRNWHFCSTVVVVVAIETAFGSREHRNVAGVCNRVRSGSDHATHTPGRASSFSSATRTFNSDCRDPDVSAAYVLVTALELAMTRWMAGYRLCDLFRIRAKTQCDVTLLEEGDY